MKKNVSTSPSALRTFLSPRTGKQALFAVCLDAIFIAGAAFLGNRYFKWRPLQATALLSGATLIGHTSLAIALRQPADATPHEDPSSSTISSSLTSRSTTSSTHTSSVSSIETSSDASNTEKNSSSIGGRPSPGRVPSPPKSEESASSSSEPESEERSSATQDSSPQTKGKGKARAPSPLPKKRASKHVIETSLIDALKGRAAIEFVPVPAAGGLPDIVAWRGSVYAFSHEKKTLSAKDLLSDKATSCKMPKCKEFSVFHFEGQPLTITSKVNGASVVRVPDLGISLFHDRGILALFQERESHPAWTKSISRIKSALPILLKEGQFAAVSHKGSLTLLPLNGSPEGYRTCKGRNEEALYPALILKDGASHMLVTQDRKGLLEVWSLPHLRKTGSYNPSAGQEVFHATCQAGEPSLLVAERDGACPQLITLSAGGNQTSSIGDPRERLIGSHEGAGGLVAVVTSSRGDALTLVNLSRKTRQEFKLPPESTDLKEAHLLESRGRLFLLARDTNGRVYTWDTAEADAPPLGFIALPDRCYGLRVIRTDEGTPYLFIGVEEGSPLLVQAVSTLEEEREDLPH